MAQRMIGEHSRAIAQIAERLSTGKRINHAKDDPAGLAAATRLDYDAATIRSEMESGGRLYDKLAVMDGYYNALSDLAIDLEGTIVAASSRGGLSQTELEAHQIEADSIIKAMDFIYSTATFKGERLFTGGLDISSGQSFEHIALTEFKDLGRTFIPPRARPLDPVDPDAQPSARSTDPEQPAAEVEPPDSPWGTLRDLMTGGRFNLVDGDAEGAQKIARAARESLVTQWGQIGTQMRRIDSHNRVLAAQLEGNRGAYAQIMDTDYAKETSSLIREQVLQQASIFVLQQSNDMQRKTLSLLMGR